MIFFFYWSLIEQDKVEDNGKMDHTTVNCAEQACMNYFDSEDKTLSKGIFFLCYCLLLFSNQICANKPYCIKNLEFLV